VPARLDWIISFSQWLRTEYPAACERLRAAIVKSNIFDPRPEPAATSPGELEYREVRDKMRDAAAREREGAMNWFVRARAKVGELRTVAIALMPDVVKSTKLLRDGAPALPLEWADEAAFMGDLVDIEFAAIGLRAGNAAPAASAAISAGVKPDPDDISKAIGIFSSDSELSDREVARRAGIKHASKLTRSKRYQRVKETFAAAPPPRGGKDGKTGDMETYE
jgi:hypothetical protein